MNKIESSEYFAIIPEDLLYENISSNAVRLYGILNRYANNQGKAWPSRRTLAELMRTSVATIDRARDELVETGWLTVQHRQTPAGDYTSNLYTLSTGSSRMRRGTPKDEGTGTPKDDELNRANMKQSQTRKASSETRPITCRQCLGKHRAGHDDGTEGLSHIYNPTSITFEICPKCDGQGTEPR